MAKYFKSRKISFKIFLSLHAYIKMVINTMFIDVFDIYQPT